MFSYIITNVFEDSVTLIKVNDPISILTSPNSLVCNSWKKIFKNEITDIKHTSVLVMPLVTNNNAPLLLSLGLSVRGSAGSPGSWA